MPITHKVETPNFPITIAKLKEFIAECESVGMPDTEKIRIVGRNEGYHFTGTYKFTPMAAAAGDVPQ